MRRCSFIALLLIGIASPAIAKEGRSGGKLLLTGGVASVEGAAGGGLASWAVIAGNETKDGVGGAAHATVVVLPDFTLKTYGGAIGVYDRVELSYAHQSFDTRAVGAALGLGRGYTFAQDVIGAKLRVIGDAVWEQGTILPQVSVGVQHKIADQAATIRAVGGRHREGTDFYIAATKLVLSQSLVLNGTVRFTKANQFGLLGFGGDRDASRSTQFEGSAGLMLSRSLIAGVEYRTRPDNLRFAQEDDGYDLFAAWALHRDLSLTAAYIDMGDVATVKNQRGWYVSLNAGF